MSDCAMSKLVVCCGLPGASDPAAAVSSYIQRLQGAARDLVRELRVAGLAMQEMENVEAAIEARDSRRIARTAARRFLAEGSFDAQLLSVEHKYSRRHEVFITFAFEIEKSSNPKLMIGDRVEHVLVLRSPEAVEIAEAHATALEDEAVRNIIAVAEGRARGYGTDDGRIDLRLPVQLDVEERELAADPNKQVLIVKMRRRA